MTTVLIVEKYEIVRKGLSLLLSSSPQLEVVGDVDTADSALLACQTLQPQCVLLDLNIDGVGGLEVVQKIIKRLPNTRILCFSAFHQLDIVKSLLRAGAAGYIEKDVPPSVLMKHINTVVTTSQTVLSCGIATALALESSDCCSASSPFEKLSKRELSVAIRLAGGARVCEIAEDLKVSPKTVNAYRYSIFEKMDIRSDVELTHMAIFHKLVSLRTCNQVANS